MEGWVSSSALGAGVRLIGSDRAAIVPRIFPAPPNCAVLNMVWQYTRLGSYLCSRRCVPLLDTSAWVDVVWALPGNRRARSRCASRKAAAAVYLHLCYFSVPRC